MINQYIWIGIAVGVFFAGIGVGYAVFTGTTSPNIMQMNPQQMQQMMSNPQLMNQWHQEMMNDPQIMNQWMNTIMKDPQLMNQWHQEMMNDPQLQQQMVNNMMQHQGMMNYMMNNQQWQNMMGWNGTMMGNRMMP